jgi:hypothetical protein
MFVFSGLSFCILHGFVQNCAVRICLFFMFCKRMLKRILHVLLSHIHFKLSTFQERVRVSISSINDSCHNFNFKLKNVKLVKACSKTTQLYTGLSSNV